MHAMRGSIACVALRRLWLPVCAVALATLALCGTSVHVAAQGAEAGGELPIFSEFDATVNDEDASFAPRYYHAAAFTPSGNGRMVIAGGNSYVDESGDFHDDGSRHHALADVWVGQWSNDPQNRARGASSWSFEWQQATQDAPWGKRDKMSLVTLATGDMLLTGGVLQVDGRDGEGQADVWRVSVADVVSGSDALAHFTSVTSDAPWGPRAGHTTIAGRDGRVYLIGGSPNGHYRSSGFRPPGGTGTFADASVWATPTNPDDVGSAWAQVTDEAPFGLRLEFAAVLAPGEAGDSDELIVMGGAGSGGSPSSGVWASTWSAGNGTAEQVLEWERRGGAEWPARRGLGAAATPDGQAIIVAGGMSTSDVVLSDVWISSFSQAENRIRGIGSRWELVAHFVGYEPPRTAFAMAVASDALYNNFGIVISGKDSSNGPISDAWAVALAPCPPGRHLAAVNSSVCRRCQPNTYAPEGNTATSCLECPAGTVTFNYASPSGVGGNSAASCLPCICAGGGFPVFFGLLVGFAGLAMVCCRSNQGSSFCAHLFEELAACGRVGLWVLDFSTDFAYWITEPFAHVVLLHLYGLHLWLSPLCILLLVVGQPRTKHALQWATAMVVGYVLVLCRAFALDGVRARWFDLGNDRTVSGSNMTTWTKSHDPETVAKKKRQCLDELPGVDAQYADSLDAAEAVVETLPQLLLFIINSFTRSRWADGVLSTLGMLMTIKSVLILGAALVRAAPRLKAVLKTDSTKPKGSSRASADRSNGVVVTLSPLATA